jgi:hypothetical protein
MESFFEVQQPLVEAESAAQTPLPLGEREEVVPHETQTETSSKLGALLVFLAPFAVAAWVAIGLSLYRFLT